MIVDVRAEAELQRWLDFVSPRGESRLVRGVRYERHSDRLWYGREYRPDETRAPDLAIDADRYARKVTAYKPSQGDVDDACRGLEPTLVETDEGTRIDYNDVNIRNADGTLNKYGKRLRELYEPGARAGVEHTAEVLAPLETVAVERADQREVSVPVAVAEPLLREGKVREKRRKRKARR